MDIVTEICAFVIMLAFSVLKVFVRYYELLSGLIVLILLSGFKAPAWAIMAGVIIVVILVNAARRGHFKRVHADQQ
jgi:hypothetical protein